MKFAPKRINKQNIKPNREVLLTNGVKAQFETEFVNRDYNPQFVRIFYQALSMLAFDCYVNSTKVLNYNNMIEFYYEIYKTYAAKYSIVTSFKALNIPIINSQFPNETSINTDRPIHPINPNGKPLFVKRLGRIYIYQNPQTKLYSATNKNGSKYTKYAFKNIDLYTPRKYPNIKQQTNTPIIAVGMDGNNNLWTINSNFQCTQVISENKYNSILNAIITEAINNFLQREMMVA